VDLDSEGLDVVGAVRPPGEIGQVELDLVPPIVQSHRHGTDERLHPGGGLVVGRPEPPAHVLVVQDLNFEGEVLLEVLDDHDEEGELDPECLAGIGGAGDEGGAHVGSFYLQHKRLDVVVCDPLDVAVSHLFVPDMQGFATNAV